MSRPDRQQKTVGEVALDVIEVVGAAVACAVIVAAPVWLSMLAGFLFGTNAAFVVFAVVTVAVAFAARPLDEQPQLDAYQRWGQRMGRLLRAPITWAEARRARRTSRALSSSTSSSSAAAPSLPPSKHNPG